ncbi:hypothetical protein, partial [Fulvivirga aurantia]|uniref:hypothetical protein n=1 Tax=Fulvivirga aurantia TaxID=2529383 RepID=UPI001627D868
TYLFRVFDLIQEVVAPTNTAVSYEKNIYLALTSHDVAPVRDSVKRELLQQGYNVLPDMAYPLETTDLEEVILQDLRKCNHALHIMGNYHKVGDYSQEFSISEVQHEISKNHHLELIDEYELMTECPFERIYWVPDQTSGIDDKQLKFIERLQNEEKELLGAELIKTPVEELKDIILSKLKRPDQMHHGFQDKVNNHKVKKVYLMYRPKHDEAAGKLKELLENNEFAVLETDNSLNHKDFIGLHKQNLFSCNGVMLLAENTDLMWLRSKMNDIHKAYSWGRSFQYQG